MRRQVQAWADEKLVLTHALVRFASTDPEGIKDRSRWSRSAPPVTPATFLNPFGMKIAQAQIAATPKI
jgi:hypothetical protein